MNNLHGPTKEVVLVLGAGIIRWMNEQRVKKAVEYANGSNTQVILTGGKGGFLGSHMDRTEAEQMQDYAIKFGMDKKNITLEDKALRTEENFSKSRELIDFLNPKKVVLVTNKAHMPRAMEYARRILPGYDIEACPTNPKWYDLKGLLCEAACYLYEHTKIPMESAYFKARTSESRA